MDAPFPVPDRLNVALVVLTSVILAATVIVGALVKSPWAMGGCVLLFTLIFQTNFALFHEAAHSKLQSRAGWNHALGFVCGLWFGASASMFAITHGGHHRKNRTESEMFDLYCAGDSVAKKRVVWYGMLIGFFYWTILPANFVLLIAPRFYRRVAERWHLTEGVFRSGEGTVGRIRMEIAAVLLFPVALILAGVPPLRLLLFYASAGLLWSTTQYLEHAYSPRSIIDGAFNLRAPAFYGWLNLHRELDLNHHRRPDEPWLYLPRLSFADEARRSYVKHYFSQWRGPRLTNESSPEMEP